MCMRDGVRCAVALALATPARAQSDIPMYLRAGDWLRVRTHAGELTTGRLMVLEDERLRLQRPNDLVMDFPVGDVERLEVSVGRHRAMGAVLGAGAGLLGGILVGAAITRTDSGGGGGGVNLAVIGVPLLTLPAGALLGSLMAPHRYLHVPRPYGMTISRTDRPR